MPGIKDTALSRKSGFQVPGALRAAAQREVARVRASRSLFARIGEMLGRAALPQALRPQYASRASYYKHCKAQLTHALAPYWQGSHAGLKARVREILHPRRRDMSLLGGLLRATVTPAALAIFMLAATAESAHADRFCTVSFSEESGFLNPFEGEDVGNRSTPAFADLDGDGDQDVLAGESDGSLNYYENTGTQQAPVFADRTGATNPFNGVDVGDSSTPALTDLDGDSDLDALVGERDGTFKYFENTGTQQAPAFTERTGNTNPFNGVDSGSYSSPAFADLDGDADQDVVVGELYGTLRYFQNTGTELAAVFEERTGAANPFDGVDVGSYSTPTLADLEGDGDLDALIGNTSGTLKYFRNTGTELNPAFTEQTGLANPFNGVDVGTRSTPDFTDLDDDGDMDALVGEQTGTLKYFKNKGTAADPVFAAQTGFANPFGGLDIGVEATPTYADLDGDGDLDAVVGESEGILKYFQNTGSVKAPIFVEQVDEFNPFNGVDVGYFSAPAFADLDRDGDLDALVGALDGALRYFENTGTTIAPLFTEQTGGANPFNGVDVGYVSTPTFADLDGDADLDVIVGERDGFLSYFKNTGAVLTPLFAEQTGGANPFNGADLGGWSAPAFADFDGDGDHDALIGSENGTLRHFENTGTALAPIFEERTGAANPFDGVDLGDISTPAFADLDGDGDQDALIGESSGILNHFGNTSTPLSSAFTLQVGAANPFNGVYVGSESAPALADLDGDGDLDASIGVDYGNLNYFKNTGTALAPVLELQTGAANPFDGVDVGDRSTPAFADLDGDGDLDALVGDTAGTLTYLKNTGTALSPSFVRQTGASNPFVGVDIGIRSAPVFADLDGDGDKDALVGEIGASIGEINYFKNSGTALTPVFELQVGETNPFNGVNIASQSCPTFSDLDGDGDLDVVVGDYDGNLGYLENTGTALSPLFAERTGSTNPFNGVDVGGISRPTFADLDGDGDQDVLVGNRNGTFHYYSGNWQDSTAPVITLNGDAAMSVECGSTYNDAGASASDDCAGSVSVTVGGDSVDTAIPGDYIITYSATDGANAASEVTRTVTVQDTTQPVIELNGEPVVFVECGGNYSELGATAIDTCAGSISVTVGGESVDTATPGEYTITYKATDGTNPALEVTRTVTVQDNCPPDGEGTVDGEGIAEGTSEGEGTVDGEGVAEGAPDGEGTGDGEGIVEGAPEGEGTVDGEGVAEGAPDGEGTGDGEGIAEGAPEGEGNVDGEGVAEGAPDGEGTGDGEGIAEGAHEGEGTVDGEGVVDGEGTADGEGTSDGEGGVDATYEQLLPIFASAESSGNNTLTLTEIQSVLPGFTQQDLDEADYNGDGQLSVGELLQRVGGGILSHADISGDSIVQLTELLRVIQFYNAGQYACAENAGATEDGFSLSATLNEPACVLHSIDQNGDKAISLSELLRGIQLYNLGGYTWCPDGGTEDGFCG